MVRVTIELLPFGGALGKKHLGTMEICNDGSGDQSQGNYDVILRHFDGKRVWRKGKVCGFDRVNQGGYDLVYLALKELISDRHK